MDNEQRKRRILQLTWGGSVVNAILVAGKLAAGIIGHSSAMVADAIHSLSDFLTDLVVIVCLGVSSKPKDENHDFGHGKYETLATSIIGLLLLVVGLGILWTSGEKIVQVVQGKPLPSPGMIAFWAAIISIVAKELLYQATVYYGKETKSDALMANAWHHRSDALSSIGTALGIGGAILLGAGWTILDPIAGLVVSGLILQVAWRLMRTSTDELLERSLPAEVEAEIVRIVEGVDEVGQVHNLCTRKVGTAYAITFHVRMPGDWTLERAHDKTRQIEAALRAQYGPETMISVHFEPYKLGQN